MKKAISLILALFLVPLAFAADIELYVNDQVASGSYDISPGGKIEFSLEQDSGILIKKVEVESVSNLYKTLIENEIQKTTYDRAPEKKRNDYGYILPPQVPSGKNKIKMIVYYSDAFFNDKKIEREFFLNTVGGSFTTKVLLWLLPQDAETELLNKITNYKIARLNSELEIKDFTKKDIEALGLNSKTFWDNLNSGKVQVDIKKLGTKQKTIVVGNAEPAKEHLKVGDENPDITIIANSYKVEIAGKKITKTKFRISVPAGKERLREGELVLVVPKKEASSSNFINFAEEPEIINPDPVVKWAFKNVPQDQVKDYTYTIDGDIQNFETIAAASAEHTSFITKLFRIIVGWFI